MEISRELALSERPVSWLVERHADLINQVLEARRFGNLATLGEGRGTIPLELRMELESIEDELIDRDTMGELERTKRLEPELYERAQAIIQRGSNR